MTPNITERKRFHWLDWLRFAAAFAVLVCHARSDNWFGYGNLGNSCKNHFSWIFFAATEPSIAPVVVFFVLSGFLVGGKVLERIMNGTFDAAAYALDRITRIYLPLLPALLFTIVICLVCGNPVSIAEFFGNIFCLQGLSCGPFGGNAPLWSLAYEFWFYLLAGYIALIFGSSYRVKGALFGVTLVFVVFTQLDATWLFCWCLGAVSYGLLAKGFRPVWFFVGIALALAGYGLLQLLAEGISANARALDSFAPSRDVATLILSVGLAFVLPFLAQRPPRLRRLVSVERAGTHFAAFSYTLYLTHYPLLSLWDYFLPERFATLNLHAFLWWIAKLSSCLFVAWLLYLPFEAQTDRVRNWIKRRWFGRNVGLYSIVQIPTS